MGSPVLILSAPYGNGHRAAAQAIVQGLHRIAPDIETPVVDLGTGDRAYQTVLKHFPALWEDLHRGTARPPGLAVASRAIQALYSRRIMALVSGLHPSRLVCTHPFPVQAAGELRRQGKLPLPLSAVITDFAVHPLWYHPGVERFFVSNPGSASALTALGAHPESISVTGIPIRLEFVEFACLGPPVSQPRLRPEILITGGGLGLSPAGLDRQHLDQLGEVAGVRLVAGGNSELLRRVREWGEDGRPWLTAYGFTREMPRLMSQADILITKAGGLTCSEALACGVPLVIFQPLPGHEEDNARYLVGQGAALRFDDPDDLVAGVRSLLSGCGPDGANPSGPLTAMSAAARRLGRPGAALEVAKQILDF